MIATVKRRGNWGFIKNPLVPKKQEESIQQTGMLIGEVKSVDGREIIVGGNKIAERIYIGDKMSIYSGDKIIIPRSIFTMQTVTKCDIITGIRNDIKPWMKVYKFRKKRKNEK